MTTMRDPLIGGLLDRRYRIDALIARGGMSSVYLGMDTRLDRPVAVKVMDPRYSADPQFLARLEFEARAVARLKNPGLVPVYDQGIDGDFAFLVMELVNGGTLRELLRERGPMPPHAVSAVLDPMLGGLAAAHHAGLVHRDIKPENLLISDDGEVKIVDFGLVRAIAAAGITSQSVILGTAAYLSPEQVEFAAADARSDIYSTGVMAFEMITGRTPFAGDTPLGLAYARLNSDVPEPSSLIDGVPSEFDEFVATATARYPAMRFADAAQMRSALGDISRRLRLPAFTVPAPTRSAERTSIQRLRDSAPASAGEQTRVAEAETARHPGTRGHQPTRVHTMPPITEQTSLSDPPQHASQLSEAAAGYDQRRRTARRRVLILIAIVVAIAALLGAGGWWLGAGRFTQVPDITGMNRGAAHAALSSAGFDVTEKAIYDNLAGVNVVLGTSPAAGSRVARSSSVTLDYSAGKPAVPQITSGTSEDDAKKVLAQRTLSMSIESQEYSRYPRGSVIGISPASGTTVAVNSIVRVSVSRGPATTVPDLRGLTPDDARQKLFAMGLTPIDAGTSADGNAPRGTVTKTEPAFGESVDPSDTAVKIFISDKAVVPNVVGEIVSTATRKLEAAGFTVRVRGLTHSPFSVVIFQSIGGGSRATSGTEVQIGSLP